ncbi:hypothetical protein CYMTET_9225 [Cymbomonas tetramitiformis]|uniref:Pentapeptide repeat-containing protein n=1 Tax=Cymbomonas tetramitiformis TaxID=36881 RepID=A0AAE0LF31_9CHLO|nr:hypothetical protein CYMTET_9225 [Cymbomonas tetramitiformis]
MTSVKAREVVHVETAATAVPCEQGFQLWELLENGTQKLVEELLIKTSADLCFIDGDKEKGLDQKAQTVLRSNTKYKLQLSAEVAESILKRSCGSPKVDDDSLQKQVEVLVAQGKVIKSADTARVLLAGFDLCKADLTKADLSSAYLCWTDLSDAKLEQAVLCKAHLSGANLARAQLNRANLTSADFTGAILEEVRAHKAPYVWASMDKEACEQEMWMRAIACAVVARHEGSGSSKLSEDAVHIQQHGRPVSKRCAIGERKSREGEDDRSKFDIGEDAQGIPSAPTGNVAGCVRAQLNRANLTSADLTKAILQEAKMTEANLTLPRVGGLRTGDVDEAARSLGDMSGLQANLRSANLTSADLTKAILQEAKLNYVNLTSAQMHKANLEKVDLNNANLEKAKLIKANLTSAQVNRANLTSVRTSKAPRVLLRTGWSGA